MNAIEAEGISYRIGDFALVEGVSLDVAAGDAIAVVGPNGAGKSTLLRLLAGELAPSAGRLTMFGEPVAGASLTELALRRSFLGQHLVSDVPFTVREVVGMGRHPHRSSAGKSTDEDALAVAEALDRMDVAHLADRVLATLSGGEEQRVHLARILAQRASVMLLDEPTTALDIGHQELVSRTLRLLAARGAAIVAVLHDLNLAAAFADRILLLDRGNAVAFGTPSEVLRAETLTAVYSHPITVVDHPHRPVPLVLPLEV